MTIIDRIVGLSILGLFVFLLVTFIVFSIAAVAGILSVVLDYIADKRKGKKK